MDDDGCFSFIFVTRQFTILLSTTQAMRFFVDLLQQHGQFRTTSDFLLLQMMPTEDLIQQDLTEASSAPFSNYLKSFFDVVILFFSDDKIILFILLNNNILTIIIVTIPINNVIYF